MKSVRVLTFSYPYESVDKADAVSDLLNTLGIEHVYYKSDGGYNHQFVVRRSKRTWNDIMRAVNSVKAVKYSYKNTYFENRDGKLVEVVYSII